jgi:ribosomal protein L35
MKTKKSLTKRLKITKNGKILARKAGKGHFNAKAKRTKQLAGKKMNYFKINNKVKSRLLPKK